MEEDVREMSGDEQVPEFQPGDVVEVSIPIEHAVNLVAVRATFVQENYARDVRFELEAELSAGEDSPRAAGHLRARGFDMRLT